ncbi:heterokaryon incompatibility protein-domain-containing protein [Thelonectria olida]|uniref:Heterokaryon incompatibility protein-domain-containing protein n=1 Tax=Thelonectria olida TaxID=1576542 RepID=A0A9P8W1F6_9HYPO|nr:heterokaryon incompatibility protein-domain-containing protein [Thelonectria olida]
MVLRRSWGSDWVAKEGSAALFKSEPVDMSSKVGNVYIDVIGPVPERYRIDLTWPYPKEVVRERSSSTSHSQSTVDGDPLHTCVYHSMVSSDDSTGSAANFDLAKQWLADCIANHPTCKVEPQEMGGSTLPARLINVQDPHAPYLQVMSQKDLSVQYCALSYRWGDGKRFTTTRANYSAFQTLIPPKEMPKTFQDAIYASHILELQYVWIDALCIIQDDANDVAKEIAGMGGVYRNALLTLTAEGAASSSHGLFSKRDPRRTRPCVLPMSASAEDATVSGEVTVTASPRGRDYLSSRGWVLQEAVLSSRSLAFGTSSISWACTSSIATESRPNPRPMRSVTSGDGPEIPRLRLWLYNRDLMVDKASERDYWHRLNQYDAWYRIVEDFTARSLTVHTDSLPALAGLAQVFSESHQTHYTAGLWKEDLQIGLGWYLAADNTGRSQTSTPSQPTWSWVSVGQNMVLFRDWQANSVQITKAGAHVLDVSCGPVHPLIPFGEVKCGKLALRAP